MNDLFFALVVKYCDLCDWLCGCTMYEAPLFCSTWTDNFVYIYIYSTINGITTKTRIKRRRVLSTHFDSRSARIHVQEKWQMTKWRKLELNRFIQIQDEKSTENSHLSGSKVRYCSPQLLNRNAVDKCKEINDDEYSGIHWNARKSIETKNQSYSLVFAVESETKNKQIDPSQASGMIFLCGNNWTHWEG